MKEWHHFLFIAEQHMQSPLSLAEALPNHGKKIGPCYSVKQKWYLVVTVTKIYKMSIRLCWVYSKEPTSMLGMNCLTTTFIHSWCPIWIFGVYTYSIAPVPAKQPWWIWINTSCKFIMNDYITTTKQSTTKPCAYFLGYTVALKKIQQVKFWYLSGKFQIRHWKHTVLTLPATCRNYIYDSHGKDDLLLVATLNVTYMVKLP